jgi:hypothetical protein
LTGLCIELKTECKFCGSPMPINALVEDIMCHSCQKIQNFPYEYWRKTILDSAVTEGFKLNDNEGQPQTSMTGEFTFHITYGKQHPRCAKCKTYLDESKLNDFAKAEKTVCTKCKNEISVRVTPEYLKNIFPGMVYLVGEDSDLLAGGKSTVQTPQSTKPVIFTCPSCAGALEIDGKERLITCKFCNSEIYLPDDLWFRIHPVKTINRWYMVYDDKYLKEKFIEWYELGDVSIDESGNVYMAAKGDDDDYCTIWSFNKDMKTRWIRIMKELDVDETRLSFGRDGALYVYDKTKQHLYKLSSEDGSNIKVFEGKDSPDDEHVLLDIVQCDSLAIDKDGNLIALIRDHIVRFNNNGELIPVWVTDNDRGGIFGKISGLFKKMGDDKSDPSVTELKNRPLRINSYDTIVNFDWEGNIYFLDRNTDENACIARYDKNGNKLFNSIISLYQKTSKPCFDKNGNVYVLGKDKNEFINLVCYSQTENLWKTVITDIRQSGLLANEDKLAVAPDGTIYCFNYNNRLKIFNSNLEMVYISEKSKKDDLEIMEKFSHK